jgi:hypothetical protein
LKPKRTVHADDDIQRPGLSYRLLLRVVVSIAFCVVLIMSTIVVLVTKCVGDGAAMASRLALKQSEMALLGSAAERQTPAALNGELKTLAGGRVFARSHGGP